MSNLARFALTIGAAALIAGCGGSLSPIAQLGNLPQRSSVEPALTYRVLHRFLDHAVGGKNPAGQLLDVNGTLYGTTGSGGAYGDGIVYSISKGGVEKTLYTFRGGANDGAGPNGALVNVNGTLYGTTYNGGLSNSYCWFTSGGRSGCGTVFAITPSGQEKIVYYFKGYPDGENPTSGLTEVNGLLYGTTMYNAYSVSTSGAETLMHAFSGSGDGLYPSGGLLDVHGTLYGTTEEGGSDADGVVYSLTTSNQEKVLHSFAGGIDGWRPDSGLTNVNGTLYGVTEWGGSSKCVCGTVYSITTKGDEQVLYRFDKVANGAYSPTGGLTELNGTLYGTTAKGGSSSHCRKAGCGTVYSLSMSGAEQVLHSFTGDNEGADPEGRLLNVKGTLYGTTERFPGTVFALTP
jgi:uncharacterized repeat protein (TIGR03803 family)